MASVNINFQSFHLKIVDFFFSEFEIEPEEKYLNPEQQLIVKLKESALNGTIPLGLDKISFNFQINSVSYNQLSSILKTVIDFQMVSWGVHSGHFLKKYCNLFLLG